MAFSPSAWTLNKIVVKVRNITGSPSTDQLLDTQIVDYINRYYAFTMPFELKEQINQQPYNFVTLPNKDIYPVLSGFLTEEPMAYCDGFPLIFYQDRDIFYQDWPQQYTSDQIGSGDGVTTTYTGNTLAFPIIAGTFLITDGTQVITDVGALQVVQVLASGTGTATYSGTLQSSPIVIGSLEITNNIENFLDNNNGTLTGSAGGTGTINYTTGAYSITFAAVVAVGVTISATYNVPEGTLAGAGSGTINYVTGAFTVIFNNAPINTAVIYDRYQAYIPARPQGVLFYNNEFTFRPIPGRVHQINMQGFITQVQLVTNFSTPLLTEWGELLAMGASLDIFLDRGDIGAYNTYYPIFKRYENVALGRFVEQYTNVQSVPRF